MRRAGKAGVVRIPFCDYLTYTNVAAAQNYLQPSTFGRLTTIQDSYELFRFVDVRFRLLPNADQASVGVDKTASVALVCEPDISTPASVPQLAYQAYYSVVSTTSQTVPTQWFKMPRKVLAGAFAWYGCNSPAGTDPPPSQGEFWFAQTSASGANDSWVLEVRGVCEFSCPANPTNTPELAAALRLARESALKTAVDKRRSALLDILASPASKTAAVNK